MDTKVISQELFEFEQKINNKYDDIFTMKLNIAAINKMLVKSGRGEILLTNMKEILAKLEEKIGR